MGKNFVVVALDASGSMTGQETRVVEAMNGYVKDIPQDSEISVFIWDSIRWDTFYEGETKDWVEMTRSDYRTGGATPLFDSVAKAIAHAESKATRDDDKVMLMIDTDGQENDSREYKTLDKIKVKVDECKDKDWAFLFMSSGLTAEASRYTARAGAAMGMSTQSSGFATRSDHYHMASVQTDAYFVGGKEPESMEIDEDGDATPLSKAKAKIKHEPFFAAR